MSTDYYIVCDKCKTGIDIASDGLSGFKFYYGESNCMKTLKDFLAEHGVFCGNISFQSEHYVHEIDGFKSIDWKAGKPTEPGERYE